MPCPAHLDLPLKQPSFLATHMGDVYDYIDANEHRHIETVCSDSVLDA